MDWVTFADWIVFGATAATLVVYRRRDGDLPGYRAPFYPWSVALFVAAAAYVVVGSMLANTGNALRGTLLLLAGVPAYQWWRRDVPRSPKARDSRGA